LNCNVQRKVRCQNLIYFSGSAMSAPAHHSAPDAHAEQDTIEAVVPLMPLVLPLVGGVLMFLLAFIAVFMA
jgi:hypothetical protein